MDIRPRVFQYNGQNVWDTIKNLHTQNQENHNLNEKRQSIDANTEMNKMVKLQHKDFKATIIKVLQEIIMNSLEMREKYRKSQERTEVSIQKQMEFIEFQNIMSKFFKTQWIGSIVE